MKRKNKVYDGGSCILVFNAVNFFFLIISVKGRFWSTPSLLSISPLGAQRQVLAVGWERPETPWVLLSQ